MLFESRKKVSEKAFEIHGYSDEFLSKQKKFDEIKKDFLDFIKDKKIIIHNAEFDLNHLNNELLLSGENKIDNQIVDTLILAREKFGSPVSLDALCKRYRIDNSKREKHNAVIDCELLAKVYINLIDQKEPSLNFQNEVNDKNDNNTNKVNYFKNIVEPTKEELEKHEKYLNSNLKKLF